MSTDAGSVVSSEAVQRDAGEVGPQAVEEELFSWDALRAVREQLEAMCCGDDDVDDALLAAGTSAPVDTAALSLGAAAKSAAAERSAAPGGRAVICLADCVAAEVDPCELTQGLSAAHADAEPECLPKDDMPISTPWFACASTARHADGEAGGPSVEDTAVAGDAAWRTSGATLQVCGLAGQSSVPRPEDATAFSRTVTTASIPAPPAGDALISFNDSEHVPAFATSAPQPPLPTESRSLIDRDFDASPLVGGLLPSSSSPVNPPCPDGSTVWVCGDSAPDTGAGKEPGELRCSVTLLSVPTAADAGFLSDCEHQNSSAVLLPRRQRCREVAKSAVANKASSDAPAIGQPAPPPGKNAAPPSRRRATGGIAWAIETPPNGSGPSSLSSGPCKKTHCLPKGMREPPHKALSSAAVMRRLMRKKPTVRQLLGKSPPTPVPVYKVCYSGVHC